MRWLDKLLGGRPMTFIAYYFTDKVSGKPVNIYRDRFGEFWMAEGGWSLFRVPSSAKSALFNFEWHESLKEKS